MVLSEEDKSNIRTTWSKISGDAAEYGAEALER